MITVLDQMEKKEKLEEIWSHTTESSVCFILGEKGLGKKELLDSFLADKHTYIHICVVPAAWKWLDYQWLKASVGS